MADTSIPVSADMILEQAAALPTKGATDVHDEMVNGRGLVRPHWQAFLGALGPLEPSDMAQRWDEALRLLRQNGVTYNVYGDPQGIERLWPVDLIPLLITAEEWQGIEAGVMQRAELLNAIAADLYGQQYLIRSGRLPASILYQNPGFLRAAHGAPAPGGRHLHWLAMDLVRLPDGTWWVLADRTNTPSGAGYALENRAVVSQVLPECFRFCDVNRLSPFFDALRDSLLALAPGPSPRAVLLTPGPYNETYFEHALLARQLGLTMVEGGDLAVREHRVYLKTLAGLEPVDVILRRLDDSYCDPLELRAESALGVPGLLRAVRAGTVAVVNTIGSQLLESGSFKAFLPSLCRHMLGEELRLRPVPSWWCGHEAGLAHVLSHLDRMVIKPAHRGFGHDPVFGDELTAAGREEVIARLRRRPWDYVGQERVTLSTVPVWDRDRLEPRPMALRVFVAATPSGYRVMPGGLTRFSDREDRSVVSMQRGGGSKDTWVLATRVDSRPVTNSTVGAAELPIGGEVGAARPFGSDLPSRVADGLFWVGRYAERTEGWVRLLRAVHLRLSESHHPGATEELPPLFQALAFLGLVPADLAEAANSGSEPTVRSALHAAVYDAEHLHSLRSNVLRLYRAAYSVRDRLSLDMWRVIAQIDRLSMPPPSRIDLASTVLLLDDLITSLAGFWGLKSESMPRGVGWRFLDMGHRLERALHAVSLLRGLAISEQPLPGRAPLRARPTLEVLLDLSESFMMYREQYFASAQWRPVLELLVSKEDNPRSVAFQLYRLTVHLAKLPDSLGTRAPARVALRQIERSRSLVLDTELLRRPGSLRAALDQLAMSLPELSNQLAHAYFSHAFARSA